MNTVETENIVFSYKDIERLGKTNLSDKLIKYIYGGADQHQCVERNKTDIEKILLMPKVCANLEERCLETEILGHKIGMPFGFSPTMCRAWINDYGEIQAARAASDNNIPFGLSSYAETSIEQVGKSVREKNCLKIMQMNVYSKDSMNEEIIKRLEKSGFHAIAITLDHAVHGNRSFDKAIEEDNSTVHWPMPNFPKGILSELMKDTSKDASEVDSYCQTWDDIRRLKKLTKLKILAKGICKPEDALAAVEAGVDAVWVSNHGGRQLGDGPSTIESLRRIAPVLKGKGVELYVDGGFSKGTDILKGLALGANCVFFGRPVLSALAYDGEEGVEKLIEILSKELKNAMALVGCSKVSDIDESILWVE
ncbi:DgyrCDS2183 [Dimorphilus gyrociliatus]|uniref:DgyrCDS2183 n=1 Tax=Dimorphilus gyrociliatus TaxID=2664684 RepID=A0A7I8V9H5_9ANNE|nr:DgyrCDS2183 [Dimorphilus gyrociliatus]